MNQTSNILSKVLKELVPLSVVNEVACFVFYDEHPKDERTIDVTICSNRGVVQEFFQRELIDSIFLENLSKVEEIQILRNSKCDLFYLVAARNEIVIVSKKEKLQIHQRINHVHSYELEDLECRGQAFLKIVLRDDAVPLVFDDNFDKLSVRPLSMENVKSEESLPVVNQLMRKLNEAKYTTKCNENTLKEYLHLRQMAAFSIYQRIHTNIDNAVFKLSQTEISNALQIRTLPPKVICCNKKIIIISSILNKNVVPITDISVLLHGTTKQSLVYTTKIFNQIPRPPYWKLTMSQIDSNKESTIVTIIDLKEIRNNTKSRIEFDAVVSFRKEEESYLLPLGSVKISALDIMGNNFDILSGDSEDSSIVMLAVLATSESINLCLRHIKNQDDIIVAPSEIFCTYLKMESLDMDNVAIHKSSPYHVLYGVVIIVEDNIDDSEHIMNIQVYSRSYSQVLALIHYLYDAIPYTIIATTPDYKLTAITKDLIKYNEKSEVTESHLNYTECASSLLKQSEILKEFFDNCMIKMSETKNTEIQRKVGFEIDLIAQGLPKYLEFRNRILEESLNGVKSLSYLEKSVHNDSDSTTIDEF